MRIGSLFAGIGGLELGLERAGLGETVWQVEIDPYCRAVLERHWPNAERFDDVKTVGKSTLVPVDLVCGGFPCQDVSSAGKRVGLTGARSGLWYEYFRIVSEIRPSWVVVENVASGANQWANAVLEGLGELGYSCLPIQVAAADVGAPHERARVFVVAANAHKNWEPSFSEHAEVAVSSKPVANANGRDGLTRSRPQRSRFSESSNCHWRTPVPDICRVVHGVPRGLDKPSKRIAALGNSVVPQCAEVIGHVIQELMR